ncbi:MAG: phosphatidylserine decarboxylase [Desulfobacteraceae bacterium]|nr:phosphatidylserine decarboxylase [Desulfobacteraceae bacterium]
MSETNNIEGMSIAELKQSLINELKQLMANSVVKAAYDEAIINVQPTLPNGEANEWVGKDADFFIKYFDDWFNFLPTPTGGLGKIEPFTHFYLNNSAAFYFLNNFKSNALGNGYTTEIYNWTVRFIIDRGQFMDTPSAETTKIIEEWKALPSTRIEDFLAPDGTDNFNTFNKFFTRILNPNKNPRPISEAHDDSVLTAPADSEINFIESELTLTTKLPVKTRQINVVDLLAGSDYANYFEGGTAVSCVLMPNSYHRYHSPVNGKIVESAEVPGIYNGIMDGEDWFNKGNIGESTTNFSIFEEFHRAYYIIETDGYGYVAMIPVGLNTISNLNFYSLSPNQSTLVPRGAQPVSVNKGTELGHFAYGGSLNILLFQPKVLESLSVLMGQRIGSLNRIVT